jgi:hypothetical protein
MSLPPRAVLVHRRTELDELIERHATRGQAAFFLSSRGRSIEDAQDRDRAIKTAIGTVSAAIPPDWRRGIVERADLPRWSFDPGDIVVVVGQDGLVANVARYLQGQPVIGINPEPKRNPGVLVPHDPSAAGRLLVAASAAGGGPDVEARVMVQATVDDGQVLMALNEIYIGQPTHQTARYTLTIADGSAERQASSGVIVCTGTGATGWGRSTWLERHSSIDLPAPTEGRLAWFVREAWPSPVTGVNCTEGVLDPGQAVGLVAESDRLVAFGDGIESDAVPVSWGQRITVTQAPTTLRLIR